MPPKTAFVLGGGGMVGAHVRWLYDWWERVDQWIEQNRPVRAPAG